MKDLVVKEATPICMESWITNERWRIDVVDEDEIHHHCYLNKGHKGKHACGYCEEGFDHG